MFSLDESIEWHGPLPHPLPLLLLICSLFLPYLADPLLSNQNGLCGGTADLTVSTPSISFSSPLYYNPSTNGLHVDCLFHFTSPPEKQILLLFLDIETTTNERISVFDHPTGTSHNVLVAHLYGSVRTPTTIYSSRGGLTVIFDDRSDAYNGPGFSAEARILGNEVLSPPYYALFHL